MTSPTDASVERREVEAILSSGIFDRSPGLVQILSYVCERYFAGEGSQIKEYSIAVQALDRPADFDPKRDSIIRVQFYRLRERLAEYYARNPASHNVRLVIPPGQYAPRFIAPAQLEQMPQLSSNDETGLLAGYPDPIEAALPPQSSRASEPPAAAANGNGLSKEAGNRITSTSASSGPEMAREKSVFRWRWLLAGLACLVAVSGASVWVSRQQAGKPADLPGVVVPSLPPTDSVRIMAGLTGHSFTDGAGHVWLTDRYFTGGSATSQPSHPIWGSRDPQIYQNRRQGTFQYDIPLKSGVYELRLHFAETHYGETNAAGYGGENTRTFSILANGQTLRSRMDVAGTCGINVACVRAFKDISPGADGILHLIFQPIKDQPFINAIEITPGVRGKMVPIRLIAQTRAYTDSKGQTWEPDRLAVGGQVVARSTEDIAGEDDPQLYAGERFGRLNYTIPVPPGQYAIVLHLADRLSASQPSLRGVGTRLFDIRCNGVMLAKDFDVVQRAGGVGRVLVQTFHGIQPDHPGEIVLSLVPSRNFAIINALEVIDESKSSNPERRP